MKHSVELYVEVLVRTDVDARDEQEAIAIAREIARRDVNKLTNADTDYTCIESGGKAWEVTPF